MEKLWCKLSSYVNEFFLNQKMKKYIDTAFIMRERIEDYLNCLGVTHICGVFPDPIGDWPRVVIKILIKEQDINPLVIWKEIDKVAYKDIAHKKSRGIFTRIENPSYYRKTIKQ